MTLGGEKNMTVYVITQISCNGNQLKQNGAMFACMEMLKIILAYKHVDVNAPVAF